MNREGHFAKCMRAELVEEAEESRKYLVNGSNGKMARCVISLRHGLDSSLTCVQ